jgi:hypothetical protein
LEEIKSFRQPVIKNPTPNPFVKFDFKKIVLPHSIKSELQNGMLKKDGPERPFFL